MASRVRRLGLGAVIAGAAVCALTLPTAAHATECPDPVITGDCAATLGGNSESRPAHAATPLTADAGAAAEAPGVLTVGLGTEAEDTNGHDDPLLAVPVADALDSIDATGTPLVSEAATAVCEVAKPIANDAGSAVQNIVPLDDVTEPAPEAPSEARPQGDSSGVPTSEGGHPDDSAGSIASGPWISGFDGTGVQGAFGEIDLPAFLNGGLDALGEITLPPAAIIGPPAQAPELNSPTQNGEGPGDRAKESGTAQAIPAIGTQDRLPLSLAVIALALVAVALGKTIHGRKAT